MIDASDGFGSCLSAQAGSRYYLGRYFEFYNKVKMRQLLGYRTPAEVHGVAVGPSVALRALFVPTAVIDGGESYIAITFCKLEVI